MYIFHTMECLGPGKDVDEAAVPLHGKELLSQDRFLNLCFPDSQFGERSPLFVTQTTGLCK